MRDLRLPNESDEQFVARAERAARVARLLVDAALANFDIQEQIADPRQLQTEEAERRNPTVRIDYVEAFFLEQLTAQQAYVIRQLLQMKPTEFWRASLCVVDSYVTNGRLAVEIEVLTTNGTSHNTQQTSSADQPQKRTNRRAVGATDFWDAKGLLRRLPIVLPDVLAVALLN